MDDGTVPPATGPAPPARSADAPGRVVEVAVDVAGEAGERPYAYRVPVGLRDVAAGEVVIVEFGRRQALGVVLGDAAPPEGVVPKPISARVRSDGPLLPPLQLALVRSVAQHYLAPLALVVRAALPPGLLERLELVALAGEAGDAAASPVAMGSTDRARPSGWAAAPSAGAAAESDDSAYPARLLGLVLERLRAAWPGGVAVRSLPWHGSRATLLRELRALEAAGHVRLEWRLSAAEGGPRLERRVALSAAGRSLLAAEAAAGPAAAPRTGPRLGPRQRDLLLALAALSDGETAPAARVAADHGAATILRLARRGLVDLTVAERVRRPLAGRGPGPRGTAPPGAPLAAAQQVAIDAVLTAVRSRRTEAFLLDGVTGAGRTAVYAAAIGAALADGRRALVLVPEIALAVPLVDRLRADLGIEVGLLHGGLSEGERADEWRRIRDGEVPVVVGTRSAILAPVADPGVVIVDEEHDGAYKSDRTPRYQARDVALELGRLALAPVVLGSATPDVATMGLAEAGGITRIELPERPAGRLPDVEIVDLRAELAAGNRGLLSRSLAAALGALDRRSGERAILVINRRGSATVVLCRDCGYVQVCPECQRPLVYHAAAAALRCHHCGATAPLATRCPACGSPRIRYLGGGTERLEREVRERFPDHRIGRLDRDVLARRGAAERVLDALRDGALDVLVGTAMVAKGIDVPEVTLVGVVSADIAMNLPDLRASERTYQLLVQAVGRAGRGDRPGRAIVQTYRPDHPAVLAAAAGDAAAFYRAELASRRQFGLPPFGRLVKLTVAMEDRDAALAEAERMAGALRAAADRTEILGPVPAYVARRTGKWRFHLVLRGPDPLAVLRRDPGPPWSVDVDPESLL